MEIIQQRLIWLLGTASLLVFLYGPTGRLIDMPRVSLTKIRAGLSLIMFGAIAGIIGRMGILSQDVARSGIIFYLENIVGCLGGWCLALWGVIEWAGESTGSTVSASRTRAYSEKLAQAVIDEQFAGPFLERIARYLSMALGCDGLSLHTKKAHGGFGLQFEYGFGPDLAQAIAHPKSSSPVVRASYLGETVILSTPEEIHADGIITTANGPVTKCIAMPLNNGSAVLAAYYSRSHGFGDTENGIMNKTAQALSSCIRRDAAGREHERRQRVSEFQASISKIFETDSGLYTPLIKSAKLIGDQYPISGMNLYIAGNGPIYLYDFEFAPGSILRIITGYLSKSEYPFLYQSHAIDSDNSELASGRSAAGRQFWLEVKFQGQDGIGRTNSQILKTLCSLIALKISEEDGVERNGRFTQLIGAINYLHERIAQGNNTSVMFEEAAQVVVESGIYPFCRITLCDQSKNELKTAALAQARPIGRQHEHLQSVSLSRTPLHLKAITGQVSVEFDREKAKSGITEEEAILLLPEGGQRGMIIPIVHKGNAVGTITVADFRGPDRAESSDLVGLFLEDIAGLISMLLTSHKEKRTAMGAKEGLKKLTIVKPKPQHKPANAPISAGMRTRINGPLAGILASCEYLKESCPGIDEQVERYLNVIERNAGRIHEITAETVEK
jgi:hypothetical protein